MLKLALFLLAIEGALGKSHTTVEVDSTTSNVACSTYYSSTAAAGAVATYYTSATMKPHVVTLKSTSTSTETVMLDPETATSTVTSTEIETLAANGAKTRTVTETLYSTKVLTKKSTTTVFTTAYVDTIITYTNTIPTPTNFPFVPIYNSSGETTYNKKKKGKRGVELPVDDSLIERSEAGQAKVMMGAMKYPAEVSCTTKTRVYVTMEIIYTAEQVATTSVVPSTDTVFATVTATSTAVDVGAATTVTKTKNKVTTSVFTDTVTKTKTTTTYLSGTVATDFFAACATNNLLGPQISPDGNYLSSAGFYNDVLAFISPNDVTDAYGCCVACQGHPACIVGGWSTAADACTIVADQIKCSGDEALFSSTVGPNELNEVYFNGQCGVFFEDPYSYY